MWPWWQPCTPSWELSSRTRSQRSPPLPPVVLGFSVLPSKNSIQTLCPPALCKESLAVAPRRVKVSCLKFSLLGPVLGGTLASAWRSAPKGFKLLWWTRSHCTEQFFLISGYHALSVLEDNPAQVSQPFSFLQVTWCSRSILTGRFELCPYFQILVGKLVRPPST